MSLIIGIAGLPNVGKSTLFNALTRATALAANHPFAAIELNVGTVSSPDAWLDKLAELFCSAKVVPATVSFVDIAGTVRSASQGEGLSNQLLANIREADVICLVTRMFADLDIVHVESRAGPKNGIEVVTTELVLADVQTLEKWILRLIKEITGKKTPKEVLETAKAVLELLEQGKVLSMHDTDLDLAILRGFGLMTTKKFIHVFNTDDAGPIDEAMQTELCDFVAPVEAIFLDAKFEAEFVELELEEARKMLEVSGQDEARLDKLAWVGLDILGLQICLTAGEKETRAWTIHKGQTAPQAVDVIYAGFERGFIKVEIVSYDDLVEYGNLAEARTHGRARMEGKDYVMADSDVVEFRTGLMSKK